MRRVLTSWAAMVAFLAAIGVAAVLMLQHLHSQVEKRAEVNAIETANVVASLVVGTFDSSEFIRGSLTDIEADDMDLDVAVLREDGRLLGLEVWHLDGRLFYGDPGHPASETRLTDSELERAGEGEPWLEASADASERGVRSLDVRVLYDIGDTGTPNAIVEVLIPQDEYASQIHQTTAQLNALAGGVVVTTVGSLLLMRRRVRAREHAAAHDSLTGLLNRAALRDGSRQPPPRRRKSRVIVPRYSSLISKVSRPSTTRWDIRPATLFSCRSLARCRPRPVPATWWPAWAGTSSRLCWTD